MNIVSVSLRDIGKAGEVMVEAIELESSIPGEEAIKRRGKR
jgi:hypothetical protein